MTQMVTVAIADTDPGRRAKLEQFLQEGSDIKVLRNVLPDRSDMPAALATGRRGGYQADATAIDDIVEKISRLSPRILFMHLDPSADGYLDLLEVLHRECPETFVVLLTDKSTKEEQIIQALAIGARGCLSHEAEPFYFQKAARAVNSGEIWVTRAMLGKIMDMVLH
jgi:DNA-binding NarL/FixJ family response regulator